MCSQMQPAPRRPASHTRTMIPSPAPSSLASPGLSGFLVPADIDLPKTVHTCIAPQAGPGSWIINPFLALRPSAVDGAKTNGCHPSPRMFRVTLYFLDDMPWLPAPVVARSVTPTRACRIVKL
jgi:hypothetical protein